MQKSLPISQRRTQISDFLCPDNGFRGKQERLGGKPKDHMRQNFRDLQSMQLKLREDREEAAQPPKELYKMTQFKKVQSKVFQPNNDENRSERINNGEFLTKGNSEKRRDELTEKRKQQRYELEARLEENRLTEAKPLTPRKASIPKETAHLAPRSNANFISRNRSEAKILAPPEEHEVIQEPKHSEFGRVPKYLENRKAQWEEEKEEIRRNAPDPNCPPGMKLMSEDERLSTLEILQQNREEAMKQFSKLPFVIETASLIRRKNEIEMKLKEIENAIGLFSRPRVYIKL